MISFTFQHKKKFELPESLIQWIQDTFKSENVSLGHVDYIICDDTFLLNLNQQFLQHDTLTDIITFPLKSNPVEAEIYISLDRIIENAKSFKNTVENEFLRVCVHGVLHLCGYPDKTKEESKIMRNMEEKYLQKSLSIIFNIC